MQAYQSRWMADSTKSTMSSQWRTSLNFCEEHGLIPLPAEMDTILLYITFLASRLRYVSIINYLLQGACSLKVRLIKPGTLAQYIASCYLCTCVRVQVGFILH